MLEDSLWYKAEDILQQMPDGLIAASNLKANRDFAHTVDDYRYLLRIHELGREGDAAPMSYVSEQASKVILHQRKLKLLKEKKEEIYERELRRNNIQIFN